ncbi:hypothetical protein PENSPDRAFT_736877 [Peniophora sp. CONT]|nr:hypothetical protein PENSPDRAFT_736877 [Peniophora sp. CONT]
MDFTRRSAREAGFIADSLQTAEHQHGTWLPFEETYEKPATPCSTPVNRPHSSQTTIMSRSSSESSGSMEQNERKLGRVKRRTLKAAPPIMESMQDRHVVFGWKIDIDEFLKKHSTDKLQWERDELDVCVVRQSAKAGPGVGAFAFRHYIWISRNHTSVRDTRVSKTGLVPIPDETGLKKLQEALKVDGPPEWHLVEEPQ